MLNWLAIYKDNSELYQYTKDRDRERLFKECDLDKLKGFVLISDDKKIVYSVNLEDGNFFIGQQVIKFECLPLLKDLKLIYYKRVRKVLGAGGDTITYCIGWETKTNPTIKRIMKIKIMKINLNNTISFEIKN